MAHESNTEEELKEHLESHEDLDNLEELKDRVNGEEYDELAAKLEKFNPEQYEAYKEEFGDYVDEHGFFKAMYMLWNEHTNLSLTRVALVLTAVYSIRYGLLSVGFSGIASVILSLVTVFAMAQVYYRYDHRNTTDTSS